MRLMFRSWCLLILFLAGCASSDSTAPEWAGVKNANSPAKLTTFVETAKFESRWQYVLEKSAGSFLQQPLLTENAIYAVSSNGSVIRLNRATGKLVWRIESGVVASGGTGGGAGLILFGSNKGEVLAYNEAGELRWKTRVSSEVMSAPQVANNIVIVRTGDGRIAGLNIDDGKRVWLYERSNPALVARNHAGVAIQNGVAYAGFAGGKLVALKVADGVLLWEATVSQPVGNTELERISDVTSEPVVDAGQVCAIAFQGSVACFDIAQGTALWNREIGSDNGMTLLRNHLYFSDSKGLVYALDKDTGGTLWKNDKFSFREGETPLALENLIVFGDYEGYLHALNREDGKMAARIKLDSNAIQTQAIPLDGGLLVQSLRGIYSLSVH